MSFASPNQYCLDKLVKLSEQRTVSAAHDIYDDRGFKLWAKGVPVSRELQAKLVLRKLTKPLESSLAVEHALSCAEIIDDCLHKLGEEPLLQQTSGARKARELLADGKTLHLPPSMQLLLTSLKMNDADTYAHTLRVVAICAGIAAKLKAHANDANHLLIAAMLHDIGETYINPEYLDPERKLTPQEWKHVATHPIIGQALIQEQTSLPAAVAQCIGQHHERLDGSGYPYQSKHADQHLLVGWIAIADATASMLAANGKGVAARIALALRIVPEEFDHEAVDALLQNLPKEENELCVEEDDNCIAKAHDAQVKITEVRRILKEIAETTKQPAVRQTCLSAKSLLHNLTKCMQGTGVLDANLLGESAKDPELLMEMHLIAQEVEWRMNNLARNLYLRAENHSSPEFLTALNGVFGMISA
ncbi:MAG: HD domain-containing protein [Sterolibacterium sp.]|nr:HD domain-containing protein [Sterolibacterium sp.]